MSTRLDGAPNPRPRILLVEDHEDTRDLLVRLLSPSFDVRTAECFDTALMSATEVIPHLVVTDVGLPGRDGVTLMRELRDRYRVPGIAVTGHIPEDPNHYYEAGFSAYLTKPIQFDELLRVVANTLTQSPPITQAGPQVRNLSG